MSRRLTLLHVAGSPTTAFHADLSRLYARDCLAALRAPGSRWSGHDHRIAWVSPDGRWRFPDDLTVAAIDAAEPRDLVAAAATIRALAPDLALPQMFCLAGMTDHRALLALLGVPVVGNRPVTMAIGADKAMARAAVAAAGLDVPEAALLRPEDRPDGSSWRHGLPDLPVVVKPVAADNSDGVSLVRQRAGLPAAVAAARQHGARVLVERYVELGREVRCGVVERAGRLVALPLEEYAVDPETKPVRHRADKLRGQDADLSLVAKDADHAWIVDPADPLTPVVQDAAVRAYDALGCRGYGLFDFRVDPRGRPWFLEAGLYCSYAPSSVLVTMAAAAGIGLDDLLDAAVTSTLARDAAQHPAQT